MSPATIATAKELDGEALRVLVTRSGPCISLVVPDHHPGAPEGARRTILRSLIKMLRRDLETSELARMTESLLAPLDELSHDAELEKGGAGWAIFQAPAFTGCWRVSAEAARCSIANHFLISPFVARALLPGEVLVLGLSLKNLKLLECSQHVFRRISLPEGVPTSLEAAAEFDRGEPVRSATGPLGGEYRRVGFGTATDRDTSGAYLHDFFEMVHNSLKPLLARRPLVLMGVREEIAAYIRAARNGARILAAAPGNVEFLSITEIGERAWQAVLQDYFRRGGEVLAKLRDMPDRRHVATEVREVLRAATEGRVHQLCVRAETEQVGPVEAGGLPVYTASEDLVNAAVAETLRTDGEVFVLPQEQMPVIQPLAAILRY